MARNRGSDSNDFIPGNAGLCDQALYTIDNASVILPASSSLNGSACWKQMRPFKSVMQMTRAFWVNSKPML